MGRMTAMFGFLVFVAQSASAAIIYDNAGGVLSQPAGDQGWNETGSYNNDGGGVAIAPNYFLTAQHLGVGSDFFLNGVDYPVVNHFDIPNSDLRVCQITGTFPSYSPLYSGTASSEIGKTISIVGFGHYAQSTPLVTNSVQNGWYWSGSEAKNWASNTVTAVGSFGSTSSFINFQFYPVSGSGMYTNNDSGGGNFIYNNGAWQLAGITYGITDYYSYNASTQTYTQLLDDYYGTGVVVYNGAGLYTPTGYDSNGNPTGFEPTTGPEDGYATEVAPYVSQIDAITGVPEPGTLGLELVAAIAVLARRQRMSRIRVKNEP